MIIRVHLQTASNYYSKLMVLGFQQQIRASTCFDLPQIISIFIFTLITTFSMSFLQLISQGRRKKPYNPALSQLDKSRLNSKWKITKSQPEENEGKSFPLTPSHSKELERSPPKESNKKIDKSNKKHSNNSSKKQFQLQDKVRRKLTKRDEQSKPEKSQNEDKMQHHDSFSNYLSKYQSGLTVGCVSRKRKLQYFNLDQLAGSLASPKKLEHKIKGDETQISEKRKSYLNLSHFQYFLKDIDKDKKRYHDQLAVSKNENTRVETKLSFGDGWVQARDNRVRPRSLWKRQFSDREDRGQKDRIVPWRQNEQQHAPIELKHYKSFKKDEHIYANFQQIQP